MNFKITLSSVAIVLMVLASFHGIDIGKLLFWIGFAIITLYGVVEAVEKIAKRIKKQH